MKVLYEDNHLIGVYKPAGVLIQGDKSGVASFMDEVKEYLKNTYKKPGNVFLGLVHRLDRNVDGVVIFAKTSKGASRISEQFRLHTVQKIYHAWVEGIPRKSKDTLVHYLYHDEVKNVSTIKEQEKKNADLAELSYEVVQSEGGFSLLKIILKTGRHHQIRAQLSHIGHPIVGDTKYGSKVKLPDQRVMLTATSISFEPATRIEGSSGKKTVSIEIPKKSW
ncbi:MAG: RNA pseudouridine synthase [Patescibacteria group bacterium]